MRFCLVTHPTHCISIPTHDTPSPTGLTSALSGFAVLRTHFLQRCRSGNTLLSCAAGSRLLTADQLPEQVYAVVEGRARLLHHDPGVRRPLTLALSHPGDLVGWAGLVRRHPCEWLTASTDLKLIAIPASAFYWLEEESAFFCDWLDKSSSPSSLFRSCSPVLRRPMNPDEREVMRQLLPHIQVCSFRNQSAAAWFWKSLVLGQQFHLIGEEGKADRLEFVKLALRAAFTSRSY